METSSTLLGRMRQAFTARPLFSPTFTAAFLGGSLLGLLGVLVSVCVEDYKEFKALGPGGVPYSIKGWALVTIVLRPFSLRAKDVRYTGDYPEYGASEEVLALPRRAGELPAVGGIAPHRQLSQHAPKEMMTQIQGVFQNAVQENSGILEMKLSHYEKVHQALFVHSSLLADNHDVLPKIARVAQGEIGHIHPDLSVHLYFSPPDAKAVIEKGWGERHRLAREQPWYLGRIKNMFGIAPTYLLVYGPRNDEEMMVFKVLSRASMCFMTGREGINRF